MPASANESPWAEPRTPVVAGSDTGARRSQQREAQTRAGTATALGTEMPYWSRNTDAKAPMKDSQGGIVIPAIKKGRWAEPHAPLVAGSNEGARFSHGEG